MSRAGGQHRVLSRRRGQRGAASARVILALAASCAVTLSVVGPMVVQAERANGPGPRIPANATTTVSAPGASVLGTTTLPGPDRPVLTPSSGAGIVWAATPPVIHRQPLADAVVSGRIWIYFEEPGAARVRFWVDDAIGSGEPARVDHEAPFLMAATDQERTGIGRGWDTTVIPDGLHSVLVEVATSSGSTFRRLTVFTVSNADG